MLDKENVNLTAGEMVLTKSDQKQLLTTIRSGGEAGGITMGDIIIQGNANEETVGLIREARTEMLADLEDAIEELQSRGRI